MNNNRSYLQQTKVSRLFKSNAGFTILELVMASVIFIFISAGVASLIVFYFQNFLFSFEEIQSISTTQMGLTTIIREIREARSGENGAWPIEQADDNHFTFYSDVTNDGRTDKVRYYLSGNELMRGITEPTEAPASYLSENEQVRIMAENIDNAGIPLFTYYNSAWPGDDINNPLDPGERLINTSYVSVYIRVNINPDAGSEAFDLSSGVQIRNLKDNL